MRPGGYTRATALAQAERERIRKEHDRTREEVRRMEKIAAARRQEADRSRTKNSKRGIDPKDRDAKGRIDLGRVTGKDGKAGRLLRQVQGRLEQARTKAAGIRTVREYALGVELRGERSRRDRLLFLPAGTLALGGGRRLEHPDLCLNPEDRIALVGPNGGGKSSLVRHLLGRMSLPPDRVLYMAQEIGRDEARKVQEEVRSLDRARLGEALSFFCRLGSKPERLLQTEEPSPGELRKILLALGMTRRPHLIVMDEPTNHMDLPSIECLERALEGCACAMLLVSHDYRFLGRLARGLWRIAPASGAGGADAGYVLRPGRADELGGPVRA
jgi:ATPase subunit of ABC transporter with duplicated ATPase domains